MSDAVEGWYGPPNSRRWHYIGANSRSLCGKWLVSTWVAEHVAKAYGPANGDCAACSRVLSKREATT